MLNKTKPPWFALSMGHGGGAEPFAGMTAVVRLPTAIDPSGMKT
jgi:hypothetical protein